MNSEERLERSAQKFAEQLTQLIENRVALALALEADRYDTQLAELVEDVTRIAAQLTQLIGIVHALIEPPKLHSVKVSDE